MRQGDSDRDIARSKTLERRKVAQIREAAEAWGWLTPGVPLPDDATLAAAFARREDLPASCVSSLEPWREQITAWHNTSIHAALVRNHGYIGSYSSVIGSSASWSATTSRPLAIPASTAPVPARRSPTLCRRKSRLAPPGYPGVHAGEKRRAALAKTEWHSPPSRSYRGSFIQGWSTGRRRESRRLIKFPYTTFDHFLRSSPAHTLLTRLYSHEGNKLGQPVVTAGLFIVEMDEASRPEEARFSPCSMECVGTSAYSEKINLS
jgi:hypothetical protein